MDAGKTWSLMGLEKVGRIGRVEIDPRNPDVVLACALGHAYGPQPERGVFRTADGGKTWDKVLFVDEEHGLLRHGMDPTTRESFLQGCGRSRFTPGARTSGRAGAAACSSRQTVAVHMEAPGGSWSAAFSCGQNCCSRGQKRFQSCVRGD